MLAQQLKHAIVIEAADPAAVTRDVDGFEQKAWSGLFPCRAAISTEGGREFFTAKQLGAELSHEVVIRWRPGVVAEMRVMFDDLSNGVIRYFDIKRVVDMDEGHRWLHLWCTEAVGQEVQS